MMVLSERGPRVLGLLENLSYKKSFHKIHWLYNLKDERVRKFRISLQTSEEARF